jgi:hypothetical protein
MERARRDAARSVDDATGSLGQLHQAVLARYDGVATAAEVGVSRFRDGQALSGLHQLDIRGP